MYNNLWDDLKLLEVSSLLHDFLINIPPSKVCIKKKEKNEKLLTITFPTSRIDAAIPEKQNP